MSRTARRGAGTPAVQATIQQALRSCVTEADIVQVLYQRLHPFYAYDVVNLQVLEREGWYHSMAVDSGVLQDLRRRPLAESMYAHLYKTPRTTVVPIDPRRAERAKGPGAGRTTRFSIWVPVEHQGQVIGSINYQSYRKREVTAAETAFLDEIHRHIGVLIANASLNELTRNQARRLQALNNIARALASTLDESSVTTALHATLNEILRVDSLDMISLPDEKGDRVRHIHFVPGSEPALRWISKQSPSLGDARAVMRSGSRLLKHEPASAAWVPIREGGSVRGALAIHCTRAYAYEDSTAVFLEQVADEVALALRNARSYEAIEAQRRRLEVVNSVGRRLASSLDRWSIVRTLREELSAHLDFDGFILATITESREGPIAEGYQYVAGVEEVVPPVPLAVTGPSREAYESREPVLVRRSPWARAFERKGVEREQWNVGTGAAVFVSGARGTRHLVSRSFVWVPVVNGDRIAALLSLQSYRDHAFDDWHVTLLQDIAAHVSLALANADNFAQAQTERARLEALHQLEMGLAGAGDERQIAEATFIAAMSHLGATFMALAQVDPGGDIAGFTSEAGGPLEYFGPIPLERAAFFQRLIGSEGRTLEGDWDPALGGPSANGSAQRPSHIVWVPILYGRRVVAGLSAQRSDGMRFDVAQMQFLETAAPVLGIALRTVRLHSANELALAQSVRIQELAALAGHDLLSVVAAIADLARTMLDTAGVVCWAFDMEGRVSAMRNSGDTAPERVLFWAGRTPDETWHQPPAGMVIGNARGKPWSLIPLWYGDRLVGAIGTIHGAGAVEPSPAALEFARHAAIAIENSRLVAETRGRIHTLEAVAAFAELDPTQPDRARSEMARLVERALSSSQGALWLLEDGQLVRRAHQGTENPVVPVEDSAQLLRWLVSPAGGRRMRALLDLLGAPPDAFAIPIQVEGRLVGLLVARLGGGWASETRRLAAVLAGQASVLIGQLELVDALDRERRMMNAILRHSPVGVMLEDSSGRIVYANPEIEAIYRSPSYEMAGKTLDEVLASAGATKVDSPEPGAALELRMSDPDRIVQVRRVVIPNVEEETSGVLTLHEDVTASRLALEAKDLMLRAIGHEVRSPAAAMKTTLAGMLQWDASLEPPDRARLLQEAYESSERLLALVENQLIIAKLETRQFEPKWERVDVKHTLELALGVLRHRYGERVARVNVRIGPSLPAAHCEPTHLEQVLTNLIGNALEYTTGAIEVSARLTGRGWLEVTVVDHGSGLPPASVDSLFDKTGPAGRNRSQGGLGLGLYLCRLVVERSFGGRIWVSSSGHDGTTFKFTVPAAAAPRARVAAQR